MSTRRRSHMKGHVVYQIYPRSFYDGNNDGTGDMQGIIKKLDYLNDGTDKSLGVSMIWLNPFYPSPMADFGYDISNYRDVDPIFGSLEDFRLLLTEAHQRGIKVMIDFVPNHTSSQHPWFTQSRTSLSSPKRDWYIWKDPKPDGSAPNNWLSVFGGSAWELDPLTGQYYMHSFLAAQPDLNWENPEVRQAMIDNIRFWFDLGIDGLRVDAVDWMAKDREFRDDPLNPKYRHGADDPYHELIHRYSMDGPQLFDYLREIAELVKSYPSGFMVTETYPDRKNVAKEYLRLYDNYLAEVSAPFNFEGILLPWQAEAYKTFIDHFQSLLDAKYHYVPIYVLGNHDNSRLASRIGREAARTAAMMLLTLPGVAFIYYGDELGMSDVPIPPERIRDPFEKRVPGKGLGRDPGRTPMQWTLGLNAGFSEAEPWLPVAADAVINNVEVQDADEHSILELYRSLIALRNGSRIIQLGNYVAVDLGNTSVYGYIREYEGRRLLILLNFSDQTQSFRTGFGLGRLLYTTGLDRDDVQIDLSEVSLGPHEGFVLALKMA